MGLEVQECLVLVELRCSYDYIILVDVHYIEVVSLYVAVYFNVHICSIYYLGTSAFCSHLQYYWVFQLQDGNVDSLDVVQGDCISLGPAVE